MDFDYSLKARELQKTLRRFMDKNIYPNERVYENEISFGDRWNPLPLIENLKAKAKVESLLIINLSLSPK